MKARGSAARWLPSIALCALSVYVASGCSSNSSAGDVSSVRPSTPATLQIVSPAPNARTGATVNVLLHLENARVVPASQVGGEIRPDQGHIHLSLDGQLVAMPSRLTARLPRLTPGSHTVEAEYVATDHVAFANRVVAAVTFRSR